jgi:hypothetical protein
VHRIVAIAVLCALVAACGGTAATSAPSSAAAATQAVVVTVAPTAAPTAAAVLTNPPPTLIPGCLPQCWQGRLTRPGALSGVYTTKNFFGGHLTVTAPDGWASREDSTGEFALGRPNDESASMEFWIDLFAAKNTQGAKDDSVDMTADAMVAWFLKKPIIHVIEQHDTTLVGLPATSIEYRRNAKAATEDPGCPSEIQPCSVAFSYPEWDGAFGEGGPFHSRLIVADAMWGGQRHAIYVMFWADETSYPELIDKVDAVIASMKLPGGVGPAS